MYNGDTCPVCGRGAARHDDPYTTGIMACTYCFDHIEELIEKKWGGIPKEWKKYYTYAYGGIKPGKMDLYVVARYRAEAVYEIAEARRTLSGDSLVAKEETIKKIAEEREEAKVNQLCKRLDAIHASAQKKKEEEEELRKIRLELQNS